MLTHQKGRTALAMGGVFIAILLIFVELGFFIAVPQGGMLIYDHMRFDLLMVSNKYVFQSESGNFPRARLQTAAAVTDVAKVTPVYLGGGKWQEPSGGTRLDVSMFDASLTFLTSALTPFLATGRAMGRMGNSRPPTASLYRTRDGRQVSLGVVRQHQFETLARIAARERWLSDPRVSTSDERRGNFEAMTAALAALFLEWDASDWETLMSDAGVRCGVVRRLEEAAELAGPHSLVSLVVPGLPDGEQRADSGHGLPGP
jgi:hypothetical protein